MSTNTAAAEAVEHALTTLERMTAGGAAGAITAIRAEFERLRGIIERDRTIFANATKRMLAELQGRMWMVESRGSYEYDDKRFQDEFGEAVTALRAEVEVIRDLGRSFADCPKDQATVDAIHADVAAVFASPARTPVTDDMVSRFLAWPLPASVCTDPVTGYGPPHPHPRTGTNLLNAVEARAMLEHVLATPVDAPGDAAPAGDAVPVVQQTAPERIWLAVSDDTYCADQPFPGVMEEIGWADHAPLDVSVPYIRADLAAAPAPAAREAVAFRAGQTLQRALMTAGATLVPRADAVESMPCPECKTRGAMLYQCTACSHGNYPPEALSTPAPAVEAYYHAVEHGSGWAVAATDRGQWLYNFGHAKDADVTARSVARWLNKERALWLAAPTPPASQGDAAPAGDAVDEREAAEHEYTVSAFDYLRAPVGSRDWTLYWRGWQARAAVARLAAAPAPAGREPVKYEYRTRPEWDKRAPWSKWEECSREAHEHYQRKPVSFNDWRTESRALYTQPREPAAEAKGGAVDAEVRP